MVRPMMVADSASLHCLRVVLVALGELDDPGEHRMPAGLGGLALHDGVDEVVGQHRILAEGIESFAEDVDCDDGTESEGIDEDAGALEDVEHRRECE